MAKKQSLLILLFSVAVIIFSCNEYRPKELVPVPAPVINYDIVMTPEAIEKGNVIYQTNCSPCHGKGGKGDGPASATLNPKPRNHTDAKYMNSLTNEHLFILLKAGGAAKGFPLMPSFSYLSDDDIKNTIAFLRTLSEPK